MFFFFWCTYFFTFLLAPLVPTTSCCFFSSCPFKNSLRTSARSKYSTNRFRMESFKRSFFSSYIKRYFLVDEFSFDNLVSFFLRTHHNFDLLCSIYKVHRYTHAPRLSLTAARKHTNTNTHAYIYIYIFEYAYILWLS